MTRQVPVCARVIHTKQTGRHEIDSPRRQLEKTGNEWADRGSFCKKPRCFDLVDVAYDDAGSAGALQGPRAAGSGGSRLPEEVQALVKALFDVQVGPGPARASPALRAAVPSKYRQADM